MSCEAFLSQYTQDVDLGKGAVVVNFKTYANQLLKCTKSRTKKDKLTLGIVRSLDEGVAIEEVRETLKKHLPKSRGELTKAYKILMLARNYNHKIPTGFKKVLKS
jgi:predicted nuclease of restriction endonuclease-like RecB superfamily